MSIDTPNPILRRLGVAGVGDKGHFKEKPTIGEKRENRVPLARPSNRGRYNRDAGAKGTDFMQRTTLTAGGVKGPF